MAKKRPGVKVITIPDCKSVTLYDNPTERCPHGKFWRESNVNLLPAAQRKERCTQTSCAAVEYTPHEGESITLTVPRNIGGRQSLLDYSQALRTTGIRSPESYEALGRALGEFVTAWTWTGQTDEDADAGREPEPLPLPKDDWNRVLACLEEQEFMWLVNAALAGGDPEEALSARGNASAA